MFLRFLFLSFIFKWGKRVTLPASHSPGQDPVGFTTFCYRSTLFQEENTPSRPPCPPKGALLGLASHADCFQQLPFPQTFCISFAVSCPWIVPLRRKLFVSRRGWGRGLWGHMGLSANPDATISEQSYLDYSLTPCESYFSHVLHGDTHSSYPLELFEDWFCAREVARVSGY